MSSVSPGKRSWKCPECGGEVLLSITQLDPMACEACLAKQTGNGSTSTGNPVADAVAGPLGIWRGLPEMTKLAAVAIALVAGLVIGYVAGQATVKPEPMARHSKSSSIEPENHRSSGKTEETGDSRQAEADDGRPEKPGPDYHWVKERKNKEGKTIPGHWLKDRK